MADATAIRIRALTASDRELWANLRQNLWPDTNAAENLEDIRWMLGRESHWGFLAERHGDPVAFAEVSLRDYANGCTGRPVPFLEGIWVRPDLRREGTGSALIGHLSEHFAAKGFDELCSDALLDNDVSHAAHKGWGFAETERVIYFRKSLR